MAEHILALDFETTDARPESTTPVEVGWMILDAELNVLAADCTIIQPTPEVFAAIEANEGVHKMHEASGLLADLRSRKAKSAPDLAQVERSIITMIETYAPGEQVTLFGSGVTRFDRVIINRLMPALADRLTYWEYDPSSVRRLFNLFTGVELYRRAGGKKHRPLDDLHDDVQYVRRFASFLRDHVTPQDNGDRQTRILAGIAAAEASMSYTAVRDTDGSVLYTEDELEAIKSLFNHQLIPGPAYGLMTLAGSLINQVASLTDRTPESVIEDLRAAALNNTL